MTKWSSISVVVPTRGRPEALRRCLAALAAQDVPLEILVVDDGSPASAAALVAESVGDVGGRALAGGRGPAAARNAGAAAAGGALVLFTDDDCAPEPGWARALAAACPADGSAAGETMNDDGRDRFAAASQLLTSELQHASVRTDGRCAFAPTSNLAVSRRLFERLPFDERYRLAAGEDRAWCAAADRLGAAPVYAPTAVVRHRQELGPAGFWRQQVRYGRGAAALRRSGEGLEGAGVRGRLIRAGFGEGAAIGALVLGAQLAVAAGYAAERLRGPTPPAAARPAGPPRRRR